MTNQATTSTSGVDNRIIYRQADAPPAHREASHAVQVKPAPKPDTNR